MIAEIPTMHAVDYRPEIDGLRAVAIVPVILFHLLGPWIPGGFLGVDVFFVISGYLITSILLREAAVGTFSVRRFWVRRVRRILPALVVVTVATLVASWVMLFPACRPAVGTQALSALASVANFYFWRYANDYWGPQAEESPFLHAWSLSVEEQFYLLYPLFVYAMTRWAPRRIAVGLAALIVVSLGLFLVGVNARPSATFYLLPTRAWELATGGFLAAVLQRRNAGERPATVAGAAAGIGLCATVASFVSVDEFSGWAIVPVLGTASIIWGGTHGWVNRLLSLPALVFIGKISYSLYLWHWPVIVLSRQMPVEVSEPVLVALICMLSVASYHLVEEPFRRKSAALPWIAGGFTVALAVAGAAAIVTPPRCDESRFDRPHTFSRYFDLHPHRVESPESIRKWATTDGPPSIAPPDAYRRDGILSGPGSGSPDVVVLGDSHGLMWAHPIRVATEERGLRAAFYCMGGVDPFFAFPPKGRDHAWQLSVAEKLEYDLARARNLERWKPALVFVCARWSIVKPNEANGLLEFLKTCAKTVVLVESPPELKGVGSHGIAEVAVFRGIRPEAGLRQYWPAGNVAAYEAGRKEIQRLAARHRHCVIMQTHDLYTEGKRVWFLDGPTLLYTDGDHLTTPGSMVAFQRIRDAVRTYGPSSAQHTGRE